MPIDGEAGVGYCLQQGFDLPPLMFDREEIDALVLGARMVQAFGDERLAAQARRVLAKVEQVVPDHLLQGFDRPELAVPAEMCPEVRGTIRTVREAIDAKRRLYVRYEDKAGAGTERVLRPLCLAFWGAVWTLGAWCELREDFRTFRVDRLRDLDLREPFDDEPGKQLEAFLVAVRAQFREQYGDR